MGVDCEILLALIFENRYRKDRFDAMTRFCKAKHERCIGLIEWQFLFPKENKIIKIIYDRKSSVFCWVGFEWLQHRNRPMAMCLQVDVSAGRRSITG